tara:strand:- start:66 stop:245 length:180 start_codon:yes stop_codon:yes gene_type:complete
MFKKLFILIRWQQKNRFYLSFLLALPIYFHLKDISKEEGITLKEKFDSYLLILLLIKRR